MLVGSGGQKSFTSLQGESPKKSSPKHLPSSLRRQMKNTRRERMTAEHPTLQ